MTIYFNLENEKINKMQFLIVALVLISSLIYYLLKRHYSYWKDRNVPGPEPRFFFGNCLDSLLMKRSPLKVQSDIYRQFPNEPYVGMFNFFTPVLIIRDPELLKTVQVKDFKHFTDNTFEVDRNVDRLLGRNPFMLKGEQWKNFRTMLTPCFTSGKMKTIYPLMQNVGRNMVDFIEKSDSPLEAKELCSKFTIDTVASCAFGLEASCFKNPKSEFRELARRFVSSDSVTGFKLFLLTIIPKLCGYIKFKIVPADVEDRFLDIVNQTLKYRKNNQTTRNDFLQFLMELKPSEKVPKWDLEEITAQAATFFGDGVETSSIVLSFVLFDLACNPESQAKLRDELKKISQNGEFDYESLSSCAFLDACIMETMRKTPIVEASDKYVTEPYTLTPNDNNGFSKRAPVDLNVGDMISIPMGGLHLDEKYFPNPQEYIPERFMGDNKTQILKYTFQPFGEGPRACIGQRFGLLQIKVAVAATVLNLEMSMNKKTQMPLKMLQTYIMPSPIGGLWIDFKRI